MRYKGRDIYRCPAPRSGITVHGAEYDWISAAHADNLSYDVFRQKPVEYQEKIIAHYRTKQREAAVLAHANRPRRTPTPSRAPRSPRRPRRR